MHTKAEAESYQPLLLEIEEAQTCCIEVEKEDGANTEAHNNCRMLKELRLRWFKLTDHVCKLGYRYFRVRSLGWKKT